MTTTSPAFLGIACNGCNEDYINEEGWSVSNPGVMCDSAVDAGWIRTEPDGHWCVSCQRAGKVPDDGGHKPRTEDGDTFCAECEDEWPCCVYEQMHSGGEAR
ncbi:MAG: hypothetical protein ACYCZR_05065 [Burkholderiales bacterium]